MKKFKLTLEIHLDSENQKTTKTKVAPYVRVRNGKKELVRGYTRKK